MTTVNIINYVTDGSIFNDRTYDRKKTQKVPLFCFGTNFSTMEPKSKKNTYWFYLLLSTQFIVICYPNYITIWVLTMKLFSSLFLFPSLVTSSLAIDCGEPCDNFAHEQGGLHICSSDDYADIRNTTSGECLVSLKAKLKVVSHADQFFTAWVTPIVRKNIGPSCWNHVPRTVATTIIADAENFNALSTCRTNPNNSPSLEKEMEYYMNIEGYSDCASVVLLHENALGECVKNLRTLRGFLSAMYIITILLCIFVFIGICVGVCILVEKCRMPGPTIVTLPSPRGSPTAPTAPTAYPVSPLSMHDDLMDVQAV